MRWCREGELAALWRDAGFEEVRSEALVVDAQYDGFDDLWAPFPAGIGPGRRVHRLARRRPARCAPRRLPPAARGGRRAGQPRRARVGGRRFGDLAAAR
jgi:hypothetical protein